MCACVSCVNNGMGEVFFFTQKKNKRDKFKFDFFFFLLASMLFFCVWVFPTHLYPGKQTFLMGSQPARPSSGLSCHTSDEGYTYNSPYYIPSHGDDMDS